MSELPTGTVTFLFSDIEGSSRLVQSLGDRYPGVLGEHAAISTAAGDHEETLRLAGAADAIRDRIGGGAPPQISQFPDYRAEAERAGLDPAAIEETCQKGYALTLGEAVASVLQDPDRAER